MVDELVLPEQLSEAEIDQVEELQTWVEALLARACESLISTFGGMAGEGGSGEGGLERFLGQATPDEELATMLELVASHMYLQSLQYRVEA